jgi:hypothetical protein
MTLHLSQIFLTLGRTFMGLSFGSELLQNLGSARVDGGDSDVDPVSFDEADDAVSR